MIFARAYNAAGFWSFPFEVLSEVPEVNCAIHLWEQPVVLNSRLSGSHIKLRLLELPE